MLVILANQEAESGGSRFKLSLGNSSRDPISKKKKIIKKELFEWLKVQPLSSNPDIQTIKQ
jgi:hypothetical protein